MGVDISKPLCRGRKITLHNGQVWWNSFKYERLPNIFYCCGKLTHSDRECPIWLRSKRLLKEDDRQFGPWLWAFTPNLARKTVVWVASFGEEDSEDKEQHIGNFFALSGGNNNRENDIDTKVVTHRQPIGADEGAREGLVDVAERAIAMGLVMKSSGSSRVEGISSELQHNDSPRIGDNLVVVKNHVPTFEEQLVEIDVGIARFDSLIGREDGSKLELSQSFLPQPLDGVGM